MTTKTWILALALALFLAAASAALANGVVEPPPDELSGGTSDFAAFDITLQPRPGQPVVGAVSSGGGHVTLGQGSWRGGGLPGGAPSMNLPLVMPNDSVHANIVVTSVGDSGPGTLRQALENAQGGDTITFDPSVFPPATPATISLSSELPTLYQGNLTIDASNAGVILDGTNVPGEWSPCVKITNSDANTIRGLQISNFSGAGIAISGDACYNVIGGDRSVGAGPVGQGNLLTHNDVGVVLSSAGASLNTITGNLIGTDATGTEDWGNRSQGVWMVEATSRNTIGPDNVIAHNGRTGVQVEGRETAGNTITGNSIHDHLWRGIYLLYGNNAQVAPTIFGFDLSAGTVAGTTCPNCTVEIFSDDGDEGVQFEGQATADNAGAFTFNKGVPLQGPPHLTATTTNLDGDTSEFSLPTSGTARSLTLQDGNGLPPSHLSTWPSRQLLYNGIGAGFVGYANPGTWDEPVFYKRGLKRARVAIQAQEPEYIRWEWPDLYIHPGHDAVYTRMAENGLRVKYLLTFWDKATWPYGEGAPCARFKMEGEIERYLEFVQFMVHHFKDRIQYYELWNEPDIANYCPKWIEVDDYLELVRRTVPVIREEYPEAKIVVGAVSGIRHPGAYPYLLTILESDVMPLVDVVSWHPFYGESPQFEETRDYYYAYPTMVQEIKDVASAHGFTGEYQVDELTWWTPHEFGDDDPLVQSRTTAAKYASRAIVMHLGMDVAVDFNGGAGNTYPNLSTIMAGALPADLPLQIQTTVTNTMSYTFSLPGDNHLVALWTNGIAAEYDPGITATVTISGFTDYDAVTGIDVLHGFVQPLTTSVENGNLAIRDLLVKDYPIIIRLSSTNHVYLPILLKEKRW